MARLNWDKAAKQSRVSRSGVEQVTEFGDVIDRARRAAIIERGGLGSIKGKNKINKKREKYNKRSKVTNENNDVNSSNSIKNIKNDEYMKLLEFNSYISFAKLNSIEMGSLVAYERVIDDYLSSGSRIMLSRLPKAERKFAEAIIAIRLLKISVDKTESNVSVLSPI
ncbi:hypothetical protein [Xanthobacter versatilis]|uniref:hypothetical protein n=1 Tax=Xanthobacter autotrophicus (strain ATCC BAA-1158 / Py2) TaxID=78245 RepID=UPI0037299E5B